MEPIDFVYTWVDGEWPGYKDTLSRYAKRPVDSNPNRYRDNLDLMRYSLRSIARFAPWFRRVVIVTQRPQVPQWLRLDDDRVRVVHHDEFMPASALPTFSSFAITANLWRIQGLSRRYLHIEDDYLALRPVSPADHIDDRGRSKFFVLAKKSDAGDSQPKNPWNKGIAGANRCLDAHYGKAPRSLLAHAPLLLDGELLETIDARFTAELSATTHARFRAEGTVAPEQLYPWVAIHEDRAIVAHGGTRYAALDNWPWLVARRLAKLERTPPLWACLNDNFGRVPHPRSVAAVRAFLERALPSPSAFERAPRDL